MGDIICDNIKQKSCYEYQLLLKINIDVPQQAILCTFFILWVAKNFTFFLYCYIKTKHYSFSVRIKFYFLIGAKNNLLKKSDKNDLRFTVRIF